MLAFARSFWKQKENAAKRVSFCCKDARGSVGIYNPFLSFARSFWKQKENAAKRVSFLSQGCPRQRRGSTIPFYHSQEVSENKNETQRSEFLFCCKDARGSGRDL